MIKHIKNWQRHEITKNIDLVKEHRLDFKADKAFVLTGEIVSDESGKFEPGMHTRTTLVIEYKDNMYKTGNTLYILDGEEGDPVTNYEDIGVNVMTITY